MTESLLHSGSIVEYYGSTCPEWSRDTHRDGSPDHFRTECTMTGSNKQLLQENMPEATPSECPECEASLDEQYTVVTWVPGERVTRPGALEMLHETNGYMVLRFLREDEPLSGFCEDYFPSDADLYVSWDSEKLIAQTTPSDSIALTISPSVLEDFLSCYPVEAVTVDDTPFESLWA